ncbi:MAG: histidine kinase dimerization/phosphoacceptor domain -containing protein, partial [Ignavibacteria bacterium]
TLTLKSDVSAIPLNRNNGNRDEELIKTEKSSNRGEKFLYPFDTTAPILLFWLDNKGTLLLLEGKCLDVLDLRPYELLGTSIFDVYPEKPEILENISFAIKNKRYTSVFEVDGYAFAIHYTEMSKNNDETSGFLGVAVDITEQKKVEKQIQLLMHSFESITEMISITDLDDRFIFVNKAFLDAYGYTEKEILGRESSILCSSNSQISHEEIFEATKRSGWKGELINQRKDGSEFPVFLSTSQIKDKGDKTIGLIGVGMDITGRKQTETIIDKRNSEIKLLYEAGKLLSGTLNLNELYEMMYQLISKIAECDELSISSFDLKDNMIRYTFLRDRRENEPIDVRQLPPIPLAPEGFGIQSRVIRTGKPLVLNNYQESLKKVKTSYTFSREGVVTKGDESSFQPRSALVLPIKMDNRVVGVAQIFSGRANAYSQEQLNFVEALMHQLALASNNALLYQHAQDEIKERSASDEKIKQSLLEKELLLKEIHHRVKNNLQIISSLLNFQSKYIKDKDSMQMFKESQNRVKSIALIHEKLYQTRDLSRIDFDKYIKSLTSHLQTTFGRKSDQISIKTKAENIFMSADTALPCGLIINELITNSLKYAFPDNKKGEIYIELMYHNNNKYTLIVKDNGIGFPKGIDFQNTESLGMKLVLGLIRQLDATIELDNDNGTQFKIEFSHLNYYGRI